MRIVIIEPSQIIVQGLSQIIAQDDAFAVVGTLPDMDRAPERILGLAPDLVVVNPTVVEYHNRLQIRSLFDPKLPIVALVSCFVGGDTLQKFQGVIQIDHSPEEIIKVLNQAINSDLTPDIEQNNPQAENYDLSEREKEILVSVAKGLMNKEIAALHNISIHTVISHRKNIVRKTGIRSVSGLVVYALLNNLMSYDL